MLSCMIDTMGVRNTVTADIPVALLQTDYHKGERHIKMEIEMVTLLEEIYPAYYKDFIYP